MGRSTAALVTGAHTDETSTPLEGPWTPYNLSSKHLSSHSQVKRSDIARASHSVLHGERSKGEVFTRQPYNSRPRSATGPGRKTLSPARSPFKRVSQGNLKSQNKSSLNSLGGRLTLRVKSHTPRPISGRPIPKRHIPTLEQNARTHAGCQTANSLSRSSSTLFNGIVTLMLKR